MDLSLRWNHPHMFLPSLADVHSPEPLKTKNILPFCTAL